MKRVHFDNGRMVICSWGDGPNGINDAEVRRDTCKGATEEAGTLTTDPKLVTCKRCLLRLIRRELEKKTLNETIQEQVLKRVFNDSLFPRMLTTTQKMPKLWKP